MLRIALTMRDVKGIFPRRNLRSMLSIALTMRDVKLRIALRVEIGIPYCLNYAGCKGYAKRFGFNCIERIALTMRDVKVRMKDKILRYREYCLNYAGCKDITGNNGKSWGTAYCLNYAGCKGGGVYEVCGRKKSIALTMRDVKLQRAISSKYQKSYCLNYAGCKDLYKITEL